jgi:hypothetical protein
VGSYVFGNESNHTGILDVFAWFVSSKAFTEATYVGKKGDFASLNLFVINVSLAESSFANSDTVIRETKKEFH